MNNQPSRNFSDIDPQHCTFCGTCVGICPHDALIVKNEKVLQISDCKKCGLCYNTCPGRSPDFNALNKMLFGKTDCDGRIGFYRTIAKGYSHDDNIRNNASSGGVVTALLLSLLDKGMIDGAIIVGTSTTDPICPEVKIARTRQEIINASQSKYCLVPVNAIFRKLRDEEGKFAFIGLPCHIHGLRKLQLLNRPESRKIFITIGLFCGFNMHLEGTSYLLGKLGIDKNDIMNLKYRGNGHPGGFFVKTKNTEYFLGKHIYNLINPVFIPRRCLICPDLTNEFADISVGDIWKKNDGKGWSSIIVRTSTGQKIFDEASQTGYLVYEKLSYGDLISSHNHLIQYKKEHVHTRLSIMRTNIDFGSPAAKQKISTRTEALFYGYLFLLVRSSPFKTLFKHIPLLVIDRIAMVVDHRIRKNG
jgi:coenzyme F420 hydrogenase subunit beta